MNLIRLLGLDVSCDRPLRGRPATPASKPDIVVERAARPLDAAPPPLIGGDDDWPRISVSNRGVDLYFTDDVMFRIAPDCRLISYYPLADLDDLTFAHELIDGVLPRLLAMRGAYVIHGSSVAGDGGAVVFAGASGAGKSTLAAALAYEGYVFLGDDVAMITTAGGFDSVVPSGTSMRLYEDAAEAALPSAVLGPAMAYWSEKRLVSPAQNALATVDDPVPLRAFVELTEHDDAPALVAIAPGHAFALLARHSFDLVDPSPAAGLDLLERWAPLAGRVPVYRLARRRDFDDLPATCALLRPLLDVQR